MSDTKIIIMAEERDPFARISKKLLDNPKISLRTKGLLAYLIGKPPGWKLRISDLRKHNTDGERSIRAGLKEAREHGHAQLIPVRIGGRIREWVWKISGSPIFLDVRFQHLENVDVQNAHPNKNDCSKKERRGVPPNGAPLPDVATPNPRQKIHPTDAPKDEEVAGDESSQGTRVGGAQGASSKRERKGRKASAPNNHTREGKPAPLKSAQRAQKRIAREKGEDSRLARWDEELFPREVE